MFHLPPPLIVAGGAGFLEGSNFSLQLFVLHTPQLTSASLCCLVMPCADSVFLGARINSVPATFLGWLAQYYGLAS